MVQDHGAAEDIAQEVFVAVFRSVSGFHAEAAISTWLYRITVNKCIDHLRVQKRQRNRGFLGYLFQRTDEPGMIDQPSFDHPGVKLEEKERSRLLFAAIETLPENQKTVFILAHIEELPQKEIAQIMDISVKAVESLLQRGKANLRKKLGDIYDRRKIE